MPKEFNVNGKIFSVTFHKWYRIVVFSKLPMQAADVAELKSQIIKHSPRLKNFHHSVIDGIHQLAASI